jgi:hypothetical protein
MGGRKAFFLFSILFAFKAMPVFPLQTKCNLRPHEFQSDWLPLDHVGKAAHLIGQQFGLLNSGYTNLVASSTSAYI